MSEATIYPTLGLEHILDPKGIDHILFVAALTAVHRASEWRRVAWLVTAVVEGRTLTLRLRLFRNDLGQALARFNRAPVPLAADARTDSLFTRHFNDRVFLAANGRRLAGGVVARGADNQMWWYEVRVDAHAAVRTLRVRNDILFDLYADQRNIVKVVQFPSERQYALSFATRDTEPQAIAFPDR